MQNLNQNLEINNLIQDLETEVTNAEDSIRNIENTILQDDLNEKNILGNLYDVLVTNKPNEVRKSLKKALKTGRDLIKSGKGAIITIGSLKAEIHSDVLQNENREIKEQLIETKEQLTRNNKELDEIKQMMVLMLKN